MAFGIDRAELAKWKSEVKQGEISIITHYWQDERFPESTSVTKVGCNDLKKLIQWGKKYNLKSEWIHQDKNFPHFDLFGKKQGEILEGEGMTEQIRRFLSKEKNTSQF